MPAARPPHASHAPGVRRGDAERLGWWSRTWRYLAAAGIAFALWLAVTVDLMEASGPLSAAEEATLGGVALLDGFLGIVGLALLVLRRRYPVLTAVMTAALAGVSVAALGAAAVATVSMATHRRWRWVALVGVIWVAGTGVYEGAYRPSLPVEALTSTMVLLSAGMAVLAYAVCVATGFYVGARRELIVTLRERAETAEREQRLEADAARDAERTRIAREMHDVLAHRISLVAMQAGALAYREDLPPAEVRESAETIRANAHRALGELRDVLGVLRADAPTPGHAEPPQPTLAEVPAMLAEEREAGMTVDLDVTALPGGSLPSREAVSDVVGRTVYRLVQEGLTNARKHAWGAPVHVVLTGERGGSLDLTIRNGAGSSRGDSPSSALGLTGMAERVALAGGRLWHGWRDDEFVLTASLPWPTVEEGER
ncbi:histidine kinase [Georgenia sp. MJ173]|uniref:sensor histidine kinase n=1 Tax=Georgenia sunbinii TaxID=3117728 RepID=UPI002F2625BF